MTLNQAQREPLVELIEAIYSHDGAKPLLPGGWHDYGGAYGCSIQRGDVPLVRPTTLDLQAFVGVWVEWLIPRGWSADYLPGSQDMCVWYWQNHKRLFDVADHDFAIATAMAVRAEQTGGE